MERLGKEWPEHQQTEFKERIVKKFEDEGSPWYASARLWDDGVIDPADTRRVVGLSLAAAMNNGRCTGGGDVGGGYGVFRM